MTTYTAFSGTKIVSSGSLSAVVLAVITGNLQNQVLFFNDETGHPMEIDFRGTVDEVIARLPADSSDSPHGSGSEMRGPGRPKLGVVAREVTLLPRHWDWLAAQPGGASVALRKLVETARRENESKDGIRQRQEAVYRFMSAMTGNLPGFEEAIRALFAGEKIRFLNQIDSWPSDMQDYTKRIAETAF